MFYRLLEKFYERYGYTGCVQERYYDNLYKAIEMMNAGATGGAESLRVKRHPATESDIDECIRSGTTLCDELQVMEQVKEATLRHSYPIPSMTSDGCLVMQGSRFVIPSSELLVNSDIELIKDKGDTYFIKLMYEAYLEKREISSYTFRVNDKSELVCECGRFYSEKQTKNKHVNIVSMIMVVLMGAFDQEDIRSTVDQLQADLHAMCKELPSAQYPRCRDVIESTFERIENCELFMNICTAKDVNVTTEDRNKRFDPISKHFAGGIPQSQVRMLFHVIERLLSHQAELPVLLLTRDSPLIKRYDGPSTILPRMLLNTLTSFYNVNKTCSGYIEGGKKTKAGILKLFLENFHQRIITPELELYIKRQSNDPSVRMQPKNHALGSIEDARKIDMLVNSNSKNEEMRQVSQESLGFIGPSKTPEGICTAVLSKRVSDTNMDTRFIPRLKLTKLDECDINDSKTWVPLPRLYVVYLRGIMVGYGDSELPQRFEDAKYSDSMFAHVTYRIVPWSPIETDRFVFYIYSDHMRIMRPLFHVRRRAFEMVDAGYLLNTHVRVGTPDFQSPLPFAGTHSGCTHLEIHPAYMYSLTAAMCPLLNHAPSARATFTTSMMNQTINADPKRMNAPEAGKFMTNSDPPLITTSVERMFRDRFGYTTGFTAMMMVISDPENPEDGILISERFANQAHLVTNAHQRVKNSAAQQPFASTHDRVTELCDGACTYTDVPNHPVDPRTGRIRQHVIIPPKGCSVWNTVCKDKSGNESAVMHMSSFKPGTFVRQVSTYAVDKDEVISVEGQYLSRVQVGDKMTSWGCQKGVIGRILSLTDGYMTTDGMVPDVIFNEHGMVSRMTMNHMLLGHVGALKLLGHIDEDTLFDPFIHKDMELFVEQRKHLVPTHTVISLKTGRVFRNVTIVPMHYMFLKHQAVDKCHASGDDGRGDMGQKMKGLARGGGVRLSTDALMSFLARGARETVRSIFVQDDGICGYVCPTHSNFFQSPGTTCHIPDCNKMLIMYFTPKSFIGLQQMLMGYGMSVTCKMETPLTRSIGIDDDDDDADDNNKSIINDDDDDLESNASPASLQNEDDEDSEVESVEFDVTDEEEEEEEDEEELDHGDEI
jgi:DNA-directed RNA polymerase beta subunit